MDSSDLVTASVGFATISVSLAALGTWLKASERGKLISLSFFSTSFVLAGGMMGLKGTDLDSAFFVLAFGLFLIVLTFLTLAVLLIFQQDVAKGNDSGIDRLE